MVLVVLVMERWTEVRVMVKRFFVTVVSLGGEMMVRVGVMTREGTVTVFGGRVEVVISVVVMVRVIIGVTVLVCVTMGVI